MSAKYDPTHYDLVYLADNEWNNDTMKHVAAEWFARHPDAQFVEVYEHAGWFLTFNRQLECCGTANDQARFAKETVFPTGYSGRDERRGVRACDCGCRPSSIVSFRRDERGEYHPVQLVVLTAPTQPELREPLQLTA